MHSTLLYLFVFLSTAFVAAAKNDSRIVFNGQDEVTLKDVQITLGPKSSKRFMETISRNPKKTDGKFLEKAAPLGEFNHNGQLYEFHPYLLVLRVDGQPPVIWTNGITDELTKHFLNNNGKWQQFLKE